MKKLGFGRSVTTLAAGAAVGQGLFVVSAPILSRVYSPDEMGRYGVLSAFIGMASAVTSLRYEAGIIAAGSRRDSAYLTVSSLALILPIGLIASTLLLMSSSHSWFGLGGFPISASVLGFLLLIAIGAQTIFRNWLVREGRVAVISVSSAAQGFCRSLAQIGFGLSGLGWVGLAIGDILGRGIPSLGLAFFSWSGLKDSIGSLSMPMTKKVLQTYREFPLYTLPSTVLDTVASNIPLPLIAKFYGLEAAGHFALVQRAASVPLSLLGTSIADIFHTRLAERRDIEAKDPSVLREGSLAFFNRTAFGLAKVGAIPVAVLVFFGEPIFGKVFGVRWVEAGRLCSVLAPWIFAQFIVSPLSRAIFVFQGQRIKLIYDCMVLALTLGALGWGSAAGMSFLKVAALLSAANTFAYAVYYGILLRLCASPPPVQVCAE